MELENSRRRVVEVIGVGELALPPDRCFVTFTVARTKLTPELAEASAAKRHNYLLQLLGNHRVKAADVASSRELQRNGKSFTAVFTARTAFSDLDVVCRVRSLVAEKLDSAVAVSRPTFAVSERRREAARREVSLLAVANAKSKAADMARYFGCGLLRPYQIHDDGCELLPPSSDAAVVFGDDETTAPPSWPEALRRATVTCRSRVRVQFALRRR